jgi:glutamine transport system substrate-binding protein
MRRITLILYAILLCVKPYTVHPADEPVVVDVHLFAPFVMASGDGYDGFDIDLWEAIADDLGLTFQYRRAEKLKALFDDLAQGRADAAAVNGFRERIKRITDSRHSSSL